MPGLLRIQVKVKVEVEEVTHYGKRWKLRSLEVGKLRESGALRAFVSVKCLQAVQEYKRRKEYAIRANTKA